MTSIPWHQRRSRLFTPQLAKDGEFPHGKDAHVDDSYVKRAKARFKLGSVSADRLQQAADAVARQLGSRPDHQLIRLYAYLALTTGTGTTRRDVHDAWAVRKCETDPTHQWIIPFEHLPRDVRRRDQKYVDAIRRAARTLKT